MALTKIHSWNNKETTATLILKTRINLTSVGER